jgi:hypothetical protein
MPAPLPCEERFRPYRHLAMRVLARAVLDLVDLTASTADRESARAFLSGSVMLRHWCRVAALDPDCVREHMERFSAQASSAAAAHLPSPRTFAHAALR